MSPGQGSFDSHLCICLHQWLVGPLVHCRLVFQGLCCQEAPWPQDGVPNLSTGGSTERHFCQGLGSRKLADAGVASPPKSSSGWF